MTHVSESSEEALGELPKRRLRNIAAKHPQPQSTEAGSSSRKEKNTKASHSLGQLESIPSLGEKADEEGDISPASLCATGAHSGPA